MKLRFGVAITFICLSLLFTCAAQDKIIKPFVNTSNVTEVVVLGDSNFRPYSYLQDDIPKGLLIEIVKAVDDELTQYSIAINLLRWPQAKAKIRQGENLALLGTYFNAQKWPYAYPYSYPMFYENLVTVCHDTHEISQQKKADVSWPMSYAGMKIGNIAGYDGWKVDSTGRAQVNTVNFFEFPNVSLALLGVQNQVVNCTIFEKAALAATTEHLIEQNKLSRNNNLVIVSDLEKHSSHMAYSQKALKSGNFVYADDFIKSFDIALEKLISSGKLNSIYAKYGIEYY